MIAAAKEQELNEKKMSDQDAGREPQPSPTIRPSSISSVRFMTAESASASDVRLSSADGIFQGEYL